MSQLCVVLMWLLGLPCAAEPLWQVEQLPGLMPVWLIVAGVQALVRWQVSHD
ncbi:MAG: hypothetical protein WC474_09455 [Hydrogenophilaceae bacterium]